MRSTSQTLADPPPAWVLHVGALGDSVLTWPLLRVLVREHGRVALVTHAGKAKLAERLVGVEGVDAEHPVWRCVWRPTACDGDASVRGVRVVINMLGDGAAGGLARVFPGAAIQSRPAPEGGQAAGAFEARHPESRAPARPRPGRGIVAHVGAGSRIKRWPLARWEEFSRATGARLIAGEVELEQFEPTERESFDRAGGRYVEHLEELARTIEGAGVFVGCDSGPTHLAAQLGVPTVALFGPTSPRKWSPVGPAVVVAAPTVETPDMQWLSVDEVIGHTSEFGQ